MISQTILTFTLVDIIIVFCSMAVIISFAISGILFMSKAKEKIKRIRYYLLAIGIFFILYCIYKLIMFFHELTFPGFVWGYTIDELNKKYVGSQELFDRYLLIWRISTVAGSVGLLIFLIGLESYILEGKTKYLLSIFQAITSTSSVILGISKGEEVTLGRILLYIGILPALAVPFIYFYYAAKTTGLTRKRALGAGFGFFIFYLGIAANSTAGKTFLSFFYLFNVNGILISYIIYGIFVPIGLIIYWKSVKF